MLRALAALILAAPSAPAQDGLGVRKAEDAVVVSDGKAVILQYQLEKPRDSRLAVESACYFHPLATPSGLPITDVAPDDHKHHRGLFLAWYEMHGKKDADFWGWGQFAPKDNRRIVNKEVADLRGGATASFRVRNEWQADGLSILREDLRATLRRAEDANCLDLSYALTADADLRLPKAAFSGFCLRMRKDGKSETSSPDGPVNLPPPHHLKPESDWPDAPWYATTITLADGRVAGGAVLSHPKNPRTLWHNATGIRILNPCVVAPGELVIKANEPLVLRYRVVAYDGAAPAGLLGKLARDWPE